MKKLIITSLLLSSLLSSAASAQDCGLLPCRQVVEVHNYDHSYQPSPIVTYNNNKMIADAIRESGRSRAAEVEAPRSIFTQPTSIAPAFRDWSPSTRALAESGGIKLPERSRQLYGK